MQPILDQFLQFVQQGIAAIFKFVSLIWTWSIGQIATLAASPWQNWALWKQILLIVMVVMVAFFLFFAARQLWYSGVRVLGAFASFVAALIYTLPSILMAGVIALGGLWVINNFKPGDLGLTAAWRDKAPATDTSRPSRETTGQSDTSR
jgi:hypothetical protein